MKRVLSALISLLIIFSLVSCGSSKFTDIKDNQSSQTGSNEPVSTSSTTKSSGTANSKVANPALANAFTRFVSWEDDGIEFSMPDNYDRGFFTDCGLNCIIQGDCYSADVVAYHEYDKECETVKKTVGKYTFDYQSFDYLGLSDWHLFVIRIAFTESRNQMEHRYYKIVYTVYGADYPESQIEKFMATLHFPWFD